MRSSYRKISPLAKTATITSGIGAAGVLTYKFASNKQLFTRNEPPAPHPKLAEWQEQLNNLNAAINEDRDRSYVISEPTVSKNVFRGSLLEYLVRHQSLSNVDSIMLTGQEIKPGIFRSSTQWSEKNFSDFMKIIAEMKIKRLNLQGCQLTPGIGRVIGEELKTNNHLEELMVTSNQLQEAGLIAVLEGIEKNTTLKNFQSRSYNVMCYYWSDITLSQLALVIRNNKTLKVIDLPDNQIEKPGSIRILMKAYSSATHRNPVHVQGFEFCRSVALPAFTKRDVLNGKFEDYAKIQFKNCRV